MKTKITIIAAMLLLSISAIAQINLIPQDTISSCGSDSLIYAISGGYNLVVWQKDSDINLIINDTLIVSQTGEYYLTVADSTQGDTSVCFSINSAIEQSTLVNIPTGYIATDVIVAYWGTPIIDCANPATGSCNLDVSCNCENARNEHHRNERIINFANY